MKMNETAKFSKYLTKCVKRKEISAYILEGMGNGWWGRAGRSVASGFLLVLRTVNFSGFANRPKVYKALCPCVNPWTNRSTFLLRTSSKSCCSDSALSSTALRAAVSCASCSLNSSVARSRVLHVVPLPWLHNAYLASNTAETSDVLWFCNAYVITSIFCTVEK